MRLRLLALIVLLVNSTACTTLGRGYRFNVNVDSVASPAASEKHVYVVAPGNDNVTPGDMQFKEFAVYLTRALQTRGFTNAAAGEKADLLILLSYGLDSGTASSKFLRYAVVEAYDQNSYRKSPKPAPLWKTTITSGGKSNDLDLTFPALMAAGMPYFGENTTHKMQVTVWESDEALQVIYGKASTY